MKIVGIIYASSPLGTQIRQSIVDYVRHHEDTDIRPTILQIKIVSSPTDSDDSPLISLITPQVMSLSAAALMTHIQTDEKIRLRRSSNVTVSITQGDVA